MHQRCSRALFDASTSATPGMKLAEKRTAIEIKITAERMQAARGMMRWCNSHQQLADGVTKSAARNWPWNCAEEFVACATTLSMWHQRRSRPEDKDKEQEVLDKAAKEIYKKHKIQETIFKPEHMEMEDKEETGICLPGWMWTSDRKPAKGTAPSATTTLHSTRTPSPRRRPLRLGWFCPRRASPEPRPCSSR